MELNFTLNTVGTTKHRRATLNGRDHYVVPMVLINPGVLNGSKGPLYYPPEEVHRDISQWNNMPLTLGHPYIESSPVSARSPNVLNQYSLGTVLNSRVSKLGKLAADGWFDIELTKQRAPQILKAIEQGKQIELSTGVFTDNILAANGSNHNGKPYTHIARNYKADHVAILLHEKGACSIQDGCGVLVDNTNKEPTDNSWSQAARLAAKLARRGAKKQIGKVKSEVQRVREAIAKKGQKLVDRVAGKKPQGKQPPPLPRRDKAKPPPLPQRKASGTYGVKEAEKQGKRSAMPEVQRVKKAIKAKRQPLPNPREYRKATRRHLRKVSKSRMKVGVN